MPTERWRRIIPVAFVMYTIAFMDRTNVSLALPAFSHALHMTPAEAGEAVGIFFWGYVALQIPGGYIAERWSAKGFVAIMLAVWGLCAVGCGLVHTAREFLLMRVALGVAEGGVWPATLVLLAHWFPRGERARANAYWMLCLPVAVVVSSPISGWILGRWGWRVMLIAEGIVPWIWLALWLAIVADTPRDAKWISPQERSEIESVLTRESSELAAPDSWPVLRALANPRVWILVLVYFSINVGDYGYLFWLPTALGRVKHLSSFTIGILNAVPYVVAAIGMVWISRRSDRTRERRFHVSGSLVWAGVLLAGAVALTGYSPVMAFVLLALVGAGSYGALGPFWAIPSESLALGVCGSAMGIINGLGNLGGYYGPRIVGIIFQHTSNFGVAFSVLAAVWLAGAGLAALLKPRHLD